jgi:hypothetical protein
MFNGFVVPPSLGAAELHWELTLEYGFAWPLAGHNIPTPRHFIWLHVVMRARRSGAAVGTLE